MVWGLISPFLRFTKKGREKPQDALQKLVVDLKLSCKVNKEREIKWIKFQGDKRVYREKRYKIKGYIPDPRCFVFLIRTGVIALSRVVLIPPELCTNLNQREVSVRARGIQRWDHLIWWVVMSEKDQHNIKHFEDIVHNYLDYAMTQQASVEIHDVIFGNVYEAADGSRYQDFMSRAERMPSVPVGNERPPKEEGV